MPTKTQAIGAFLLARTHKDLANQYSTNMECQVNVAQDGGERIEGDFKGRKWHGWTDSLTTWKSFRIPYKAYSDPEYEDTEIKFDLAEHAEAIGMTGWDWKNRISKWVAYDFDALMGHSDKHTGKLTNEELDAVREAAFNIEWVTVRKSTSGKGLHIYVYLNDIPTANHNEHAALARAILGKMSAITGFNFESKVDICMPKDTWIQTKDGARQIKDLLGKPNIFIINGIEEISPEGFFYTGYKTIFEIKTVKGYKVRATEAHPFLTGCKSFNLTRSYPTLLGFSDIKTKKKLSDLKIGDKLYLNRHENLSWGGEGTYEEGYILGWLFGDGYFSSRPQCNNYEHSLDFFKDDQDLVPYVSYILPASQCYIDGPQTKVSLRSPFLEELRQRFNLDVSKSISQEIEETSSDFYKGFISAFFDSDGSANKTKALVELKQSNLPRLEALQRMLLRLGIISDIFNNEKDKEEVILGRKCKMQSKYTLTIGRENILTFTSKIGFRHPSKYAKLNEQITRILTKENGKKKLAIEHFTDYIESITEIGEECVYATHVCPSHLYDANGFITFNCGQNMWVWHRKMAGTDGLRLLKTGIPLEEIPPNWQDHIKVVTGTRRKNLPQEIENAGLSDLFEELSGQQLRIPLDEDHKKLINYLKDNDLFWWWDQDHNMLVTHTHHLKSAHKELILKGFFDTNSEGKNLNEQNCFCHPLRKGGWVIRRYSFGVQEHESWSQDGQGWTRCFYNVEPDLQSSARAFGGLEDPRGGFVFREAEIAAKATDLLGVKMDLKAVYMSRETILKEHKDGRLIVEIERKDQDRADEMTGWLPDKDKWKRIYNKQLATPTEPETANYDDMVRHLVTESGDDYGWMIKSDGIWRSEPLIHLKVALSSLGLNGKDVTQVLGSSIFKCWKVVNKPFQPEYPGEREWNRNASQLRFLPSKDLENLQYKTWMQLLNHCGSGLDETVKNNPWCKANGVLRGGEYLKCWVASLFKEPLEPLPYLFFYGPQNSGKSIFHEALNLLLTKGYKRADAALISQAGFNAELEGAIICVVEETDLRKNMIAYNRIKDWVTSLDLSIHCKGKTPYHIPNSTHWIQCANDHQACPIFSGDTRITMCYVEPLNPIELIPKKVIIPMLEKEAPNFLAEILNLELPPSMDRLNVPVLMTEDKGMVQQLNKTHLEMFIDEKCRAVHGRRIKFSDFFAKLQEWLDPNEIHRWSKIRVGRETPPTFPKGRIHEDGQFYLGNIAWTGEVDSTESSLPKLIVKDGYLEPSNI